MSDDELAGKAQVVIDYVAPRVTSGGVAREIAREDGPLDGLIMALTFATQDGLALPAQHRQAAREILAALDPDQDQREISELSHWLARSEALAA